MKIAIIGAGISGLVSAHLLQRRHEITLFEAADYIGGHTNTIDVEAGGREYPVDTGFVVFNDRNYPNFTRLLRHLGVASKPTSMSFSVRCDRSGLEYNGTSINGLFAQRRNIVSPRFWRLLRDLVRFYRSAPQLLEQGRREDLTLGEYLHEGRYSEVFIEQHILPMACAIWSSSRGRIGEFPMRSFVDFFRQHGFFNLGKRPQWYVIEGGSKRYVEALTAPFRDRIRLSSPVQRVTRDFDGVAIDSRHGAAERFDAVVLAVHSDQALRLLGDPSPREREILGAIPFQRNDTLLHRDVSLLPRQKRAWASWNYHVLPSAPPGPTLTYNMNMLQGLDAPTAEAANPFCVTLNRNDAVDPALRIRELEYSHPIFTVDAVRAQSRHAEINGDRNTYYCGAYWGYGFHRDGVKSALTACRSLEREPINVA